MTFVYPCHVDPIYTLFELPLSWLWLPPPAPMHCLAWPLAQICKCFVLQSSRSFGKAILLHTCPLFPLKFLHLLPLRPLCTTPLNSGFWQQGKGKGQKKNMPHGKLYLFPLNTYLKEMSQAHPENWVRVTVSLPTWTRLIQSHFLKLCFCFVISQNTA